MSEASDETDEVEKAPEPPFVVALKKPIRKIIKGKEDGFITEVTIQRRPTFEDLEAVDGKGKLASLKIALSRLSDLPLAFIGKLDVLDVRGLDDAINPLFETDEPDDPNDDEPPSSTSAGTSP